MKTYVKFLIAGGVIAAVGVIIMLVALAVGGWSLKAKYEMKTFTSQEEFSTVYVRQDAGSVKCEYYDGSETVIEYPTSKLFDSAVKIEDGALKVQTRRKWYALWGNPVMPETVIKLPRSASGAAMNFKINAGSTTLGSGTYGNITVNIDAGQFAAGDIECAALKCNINAGQIKINSVQCALLELDVDAGRTEISSIDAAKTIVNVDAGSAVLGFCGAQSEYTVNVKIDAGSCNVGNSTGTTDKTILLDIDAGSAKLTFSV